MFWRVSGEEVGRYATCKAIRWRKEHISICWPAQPSCNSKFCRTLGKILHFLIYLRFPPISQSHSFNELSPDQTHATQPVSWAQVSLNISIIPQINMMRTFEQGKLDSSKTSLLKLCQLSNGVVPCDLTKTSLTRKIENYSVSYALRDPEIPKIFMCTALRQRLMSWLHWNLLQRKTNWICLGRYPLH